MASCIVNNPPSHFALVNDNRSNSDGSLNPQQQFGNFFLTRYKKQSTSREFKSGLSNLNVLKVSPLQQKIPFQPLPPLTELMNRFQTTSTNNNIVHTQNDHVDLPVGTDYVSSPIGTANGYVFPTRSKVHQHFKQFSINLGRFGNIQGVGALHYQNIFPYGVR
jgi:hypothetical protein